MKNKVMKLIHNQRHGVSCLAFQRKCVCKIQTMKGPEPLSCLIHPPKTQDNLLKTHRLECFPPRPLVLKCR